MRKWGGFLTKQLPTSLSVLELKIGHDVSLLIQDDHVVVVPRPIEAGVVSDLLP